jgi:hypothetical protein
VSEIFDEVDEELRRDQLRKIWERYSVFVVGGAILIVVAVAGWRGYQYWQNQRATQAGAAFEAAITLSEQNKHAEAAAAFTKLAADAPSGYRVLARLRAAAEASVADPQAGIKLYDAIGADPAVDQTEQDLAKTRAAALLVDTASYDEMRQRLEPLTGAGRTFRHTARDLLAFSAWHGKDDAAARQWIELIANDAETPSSIRSRAETLQSLLPPAAKG